jgi:hypothetical protein
MKYIKLFENYSKEEIKNFLLKAQKNSQVEIKTNIDELLSKLEQPEIGTFEYFVETEARFISEYNYQHMGSYIDRFEELGLDTSRIEELLPSLLRYKKIQMKEIERYEHGGYSRKEREMNLDRLYDEMDELAPYVEELEKEVKKLAKQAKLLM